MLYYKYIGRRLARRCLQASDAMASPNGEGRRKMALKMHKKNPNFKFSPAAPIGTAGDQFLLFNSNDQKSKKMRHLTHIGQLIRFGIGVSRNFGM